MGYPKENPEYLKILNVINDSLNKPLMSDIIAKKLDVRKQYVANLLRLAAKKHKDTEVLFATERSPKIYVFKTKVTLADLFPLVKGNPLVGRVPKETPAVGANYDMFRQIQVKLLELSSKEDSTTREIADMSDRISMLADKIDAQTKAVNALLKAWETPLDKKVA